jgi:hypothetical protein
MVARVRMLLRPIPPCAVLCALLLAGPGSRPAAADVPQADPLKTRTIDVLPLVENRLGKPELMLAQRSITRDFGKTTNDVGPEPEFSYVDIPGWKNPAPASLMSAVVPGTGQLYAGSKRGYIFLGVEAVAVMAFVKYRNDSHDKEAFTTRTSATRTRPAAASRSPGSRALSPPRKSRACRRSTRRTRASSTTR